MSEHFPSSSLTDSSESVCVGYPALSPRVHSVEEGNAKSNVLVRIVERKIRENSEIEADIASRALQQSSSLPLPFADALASAGKFGQFPIIAEMKRCCPSAGPLRNGNYAPVEHARDYDNAGAACLSVLTDQDDFGGEREHLQEARKGANKLPILRKDFIVDEIQIVESRALGADAVLLIAALGKILGSDFKMEKWANKAQESGMSVIVEIRNEEELKRALKIPDVLIGINNRDLETFEVSLKTTFRAWRQRRRIRRALCDFRKRN